MGNSELITPHVNNHAHNHRSHHAPLIAPHNTTLIITPLTASAPFTSSALVTPFARVARYSAKLRVQLEQMVAHVRTNLEKNERTKINTMLRDSIMEAREFEWESQLRFYWDKEEDDLLVRAHVCVCVCVRACVCVRVRARARVCSRVCVRW